MQNIIEIRTRQKNYPIYFPENPVDFFSKLKIHLQSDQIMIVTDTEVANYHLAFLESISVQLPVDVFIMQTGEAGKNFAQLNMLWDLLIAKQYRRNATIIALGGGVVGDLAGFAAATYMRGIHFIQIPTTLLAQVDASVGGKTAINHAAAKNIIGAFYQPDAVIVYLPFLKTLLNRHMANGIAEIIKMALLFDGEFFFWLSTAIEKIRQQDAKTLYHAIRRAIELKTQIVERDEKEKNIRAFLNFGHTFGHAIEQSGNYQIWLHGEAVAIGMMLALELSQQCAVLKNPQLIERTRRLLRLADLPTALPESIHLPDLIKIMQHDKKNQSHRIRFVLLEEIGKPVMKELSIEELLGQRQTRVFPALDTTS